MKVVDPGHDYELTALDGDSTQRLRFVKRSNPPEKFPGNVGNHSGTTMQEVLRCLIDRARYVNAQIPDESTGLAIDYMRVAIWELEKRAARRHGRMLDAIPQGIENLPTCIGCGHIECADDHVATPRGGE